MADEPTLFEQMTPVEQGEQLKKAAMEQVDENADADWKTGGLEAIHQAALALFELTTDDIWPTLDDSDVSTHERKAIGPLMREAARRGWIAPTDRIRKSNRPVCHRNPKAVWRSLVYQGNGTV